MLSPPDPPACGSCGFEETMGTPDHGTLYTYTKCHGRSSPLSPQTLTTHNPCCQPTHPSPTRGIEIGNSLPNNQRQHHTLHIQEDVLSFSHCADYCAPCQPLLRAFFGWIRSPPPTLFSFCCDTRHPYLLATRGGSVDPEARPAITPLALAAVSLSKVQGFLAHKELPPRRTLR